MDRALKGPGSGGDQGEGRGDDSIDQLIAGFKPTTDAAASSISFACYLHELAHKNRDFDLHRDALQRIVEELGYFVHILDDFTEAHPETLPRIEATRAAAHYEMLVARRELRKVHHAGP